jgi:hypothetical protein
VTGEVKGDNSLEPAIVFNKRANLYEVPGRNPAKTMVFVHPTFTKILPFVATDDANPAFAVGASSTVEDIPAAAACNNIGVGSASDNFVVPTGRADDAREADARGDVAVPSIAITYPIKGRPPVLSAAGSTHDSSIVDSRTEIIIGPTEGDSGGVAIAVEKVVDHIE